MPNPESPTPDPAEGLAALIAELRREMAGVGVLYVYDLRLWLDRLETALAARVARSAPQEWQPIETAPKDGREILVYDDGAILLALWVDDDDGVGWWDHGILAPAPTYWMPLPDPPRQEPQP